MYEGTCQYFVHDMVAEECILLKTNQLNFCNTRSGSPLTNIKDCEIAFNEENEQISCLVSIGIYHLEVHLAVCPHQ